MNEMDKKETSDVSHPSTSDDAENTAVTDDVLVTWKESRWLDEYEPFRRRARRQAILDRDLGRSHRFSDRARRRTRMFRDDLRRLSDPLIVPPHKRKDVVRFVHVSDTHNMHDHLALPEGDVLIHTGDAVGNYRRQDVNDHFVEFCAWLTRMSKRFKTVIFISGNHDTMLDDEFYDTRKAMSLIKNLPSNVHYLCNNGIIVQGNIRVWGSPLCVSRKEALGKRYLSDAFERPIATRTNVYNKYLKDGEIDVLLTHVPPAGILCANRRGARKGPGDHVLRARLDELKTPPRWHCFGHDHDYLGAIRKGPTLYINASQQQLLHEHIRIKEAKYRCGGFPFVFDVPIRSTA